MRVTELVLLWMLIAAALLPACHPVRSIQADKETVSFNARVVRVPIEGGFFGLVDNRGNRYLPDNLPAGLQRDQLPVRVRARYLPPAPGYRMWGRRIHIVEIDRR